MEKSLNPGPSITYDPFTTQLNSVLKLAGEFIKIDDLELHR